METGESTPSRPAVRIVSVPSAEDAGIITPLNGAPAVAVTSLIQMFSLPGRGWATSTRCSARRRFGARSYQDFVRSF